MKNYFSRLFVLLIACMSIFTMSYSNVNNSDFQQLLSLKLYKHMTEELAKMNKKEEGKSESFYEKLLHQTASITKTMMTPVLPYIGLATFASLTWNNLIYSVVPSWLLRGHPSSLADYILKPHVLILLFLLAQ